MFSIEEYFKIKDKVFNQFSSIFSVDKCALVIFGDRRIFYIVGNGFSEEENKRIRERFINSFRGKEKVDVISNEPLNDGGGLLQSFEIGRKDNLSINIIYESTDKKVLIDRQRRKVKRLSFLLYQYFREGFDDAHLRIMSSVVKNIDTGFLVFGEDEKVLFFNERMTKILGLATEDIMGRNIYDVMGGVYKRWEKEQVDNIVRTKKTEVIERYERVRQSGKSEYHKVGLTRAETIWGEIYILVDNDLTQWVEIEKLSRYKSDFIASIAHDLKTPLTTIIGYMDILKTGLGSSITYQNRRCIEQSIKEARRLARMIDQTLELSSIDLSLTDERRKILEKTWLSVQILLSVLMDDFYQRAEDKGLELATEVEAGVNTIYTDEKKILEILRNLLDNAIKFTLPGGRVNIRVIKKKEDIVFELIDTGIGIPDEDLDRIFERFYRVEREDSSSYGGIGLGLYIVREFVKMLNGKIEVESELGVGTTFRLFLPQPQIK